MKEETTKETTSKTTGIVVDANLLAKYPEPSARAVAKMAHEEELRLETRRVALATDKANLVAMKERVAVNEARTKARVEESNEPIKVSASELEKKIKEDEAKLAEDSK